MLPQIALWLWLVGAVVMLSWMLMTNYRFYRLTRKSKQMMSFGFPLPVYLMESLASPCLVGVLKPRILLNRASIRSQEMLDMVLLQEMTHFQHRDNLWTTLRTLLLCLWWWNPLVWAACKYSREDCEAACDEAVVSKMTSTERQVYGLSLIELMRQNTGKVLQLSVGTGMRSGKKQMEERITMIKVFKHVKWKTATCFLLCLALLLPFMLTSFADDSAESTQQPDVLMKQFYEKTIEKEGSHGLMRDWESSDHIAFVEMMLEAGIELDDKALADMNNEDLTEKVRGEIAWKIIQDYYPSRDSVLTAVDVIAKEKGPIEYWSLEDKAWFSEMMLKYQPDEVSGVNLLPSEDDITQEQAMEIMYDYYLKEYGLTREQFDEEKISVYFSENINRNGSTSEKVKAWGMNLWLIGDPEPFGISILSDGTIRRARGPYVRTWRDDWYDTIMSDEYWTIEGMVKLKNHWGPRVEALLAEVVCPQSLYQPVS